ncbi:phospholipase-like protein [Tanacetum coccineum]
MEVQHSRRRQAPLSLKAPKQLLLMIIIHLPGFRIPHHRDVGLVNLNLMNRERREARPSIRNKGRNANVAPFNLGNAFVDYNEVDDEVLITGVRDTDDYIVYENVNPNKVRRERYNECMQFLYNPHHVYLDCHIMGYSVPELFWRELLLNLYMGGYHVVDDPNTEGWLSGDQMNAWIELLFRDRLQGAKFTIAKSGTSSFHLRSKMFIIQTDPHIIGTLDGSTCPYPSWDEVDWVYMPINAGGDHWVTGAINLPNSRFYVFVSLHSEVRMSTLYDHIRNWTNVVNVILENRGHFQ